jgi:hypothetical protein
MAWDLPHAVLSLTGYGTLVRKPAGALLLKFAQVGRHDKWRSLADMAAPGGTSKVVVFGATGLIGHGVLCECLADPGVDEVVVVGRTATGQRHPKLREVRHEDFLDLGPILDELAGVDACFWCLGVSSVGMKPRVYERVTYDYTLAAARALAVVNPNLTFVYVSGAGTDSTERGRVRWARVKGRTENAVLEMFVNGYAFRPAFVEPSPGARSKTRLYRVGVMVLSPLVPLLKRWFGGLFVTGEQLGRAMLRVARDGWPQRVLENRDVVAAGGGGR